MGSAHLENHRDSQGPVNTGHVWNSRLDSYIKLAWLLWCPKKEEVLLTVSQLAPTTAHRYMACLPQFRMSQLKHNFPHWQGCVKHLPAALPKTSHIEFKSSPPHHPFQSGPALNCYSNIAAVVHPSFLLLQLPCLRHPLPVLGHWLLPLLLHLPLLSPLLLISTLSSFLWNKSSVPTHNIPDPHVNPTAGSCINAVLFHLSLMILAVKTKNQRNSDCHRGWLIYCTSTSTCSWSRIFLFHRLVDL